MNYFRYCSAGHSGWLAVATGSQLLVVHPRAIELGVSVFDRSGSGPVGVPTVLDELTSAGLSSTPDFALLEFSDGADGRGLRAIVRGAVRVVVSAGGSSHTLDGSGVTTWTEQSFAAVSALEVDIVAEARDGGGDGPWLPLHRGAALVSRIALADGQSSELSQPVIANAAGEHPVAGPTPAAVAETTAAESTAADTTVAETAVAETAVSETAVAETALAETPVAETTIVDYPAEPASGSPAAQGADARPGDEGYDYLFGETMYRNVSEAAVHEPESDPETAPPAETGAEPAGNASTADDQLAGDELAGDHDGLTIMTGDLKKLRGSRAARASAAADAAPVPPSPTLYLELSTGGREPLSQPILVGRAPTANKVSGGALPRLVTIPGDKDISRNHAKFVAEGGTVVVTDLHSRNGTQIIMPGKPAEQLRQGEPTAVIIGTIVDLGGGVTVTVGEEK